MGRGGVNGDGSEKNSEACQSMAPSPFVENRGDRTSRFATLARSPNTILVLKSLRLSATVSVEW